MKQRHQSAGRRPATGTDRSLQDVTRSPGKMDKTNLEL